MKDTQKFTLTIGQLKALVAEATGNEEIDEGVWDTVKGWFGGGKKNAAQGQPAPAQGQTAPAGAPAAGAPAAPAGQPAQDPQKEQGIVKKLLGDFLQKLTAVKDPFKLRKVLTAIIDSEDALEAIQSIQQIKKEADAEDAAKPEGQEGQEQPEQQQAAESLLEDDENPWGSWEPSAEEAAQYVFDHYEEISGVPKSMIYDIMLGDGDLDDMAPAVTAISDWLDEQGLDKDMKLEVLQRIDGLFVENAPETVDEGLWDRFKAKAAGWMGAAKAVGNNINRWANSDDQGNSDIKKQSIRGAGQTEKFATLINQYIKKIEWLKNAVIKANEFYRKDEGQGKLAADMVAKMDAFIQQAQAALKQTKDDLKANGYDRKAQGQQQDGDANKKPEDGEKKDDGGKKPEGGDGEKKPDEKPADDKDDKGDEKKVDENTKVRLTLGQIRKLVKEASLDDIPDLHEYVAVFDEDDSFEFQEADRNAAFSTVAMHVSDTGEYPLEFTEDGIDILDEFDLWCDSDMVDEGLWNAIKGAGQAFGKSIKQTAKNAVATTMGAAKELGSKKAWNRSTWTLDDYAQKLARIVAELEMDLKDMSWSPKQNPGLAKVIKDLEVSANEIHKKGEQGQASNWDKLRHQAGKMAGAAAMGAVQGLVLGALLKPLRSFMSPRWYAALVAAATVLLRALMRNMEKMDLKDDDKEEKAAAEAALAKGEAMNPPNHTYTDENGKEVTEPETGVVNLNGKDIKLPVTSKEDVEAVRKILKSLDMKASVDSKISEIINDEAGAFFAGQKGAKETADIIQSRVKVYISETK